MASDLSGKRLLLVSEDLDLSGLVAVAAARLGAEVEAVPSGRAALESLERSAPAAVILDVPVADLGAAELFAACARAGVPALAVSGVLRGPAAAEEAHRLGAREFFEKPFEVEALAAAAARLVGAAAPRVDREVPDEVTGSRPLSPEEVPAGISASPLPALDDPPPSAAAPARRDGFSTPLPDTRRARTLAAEVPPRPSGDLAQTTVPRILVSLHVGQATGALTLARGPVRKILVVERGVPVYAASNVGAERFGAICVRRGVLTAEALAELRREAPQARTADLLAERGLVPPARRAELLAGQLRAIAWSTFEWRDGSYDFQLGRPPAGRVPLQIPMCDLVLDGMRRASTLPRLRAELGAAAHLAPAPDPAFELHALRLLPAEAHLLAVADGTKRIEDLLRLTELPERDALAFLQACRVMRVLDEVDRVLASTRRIGFM